MYFFIFFYFFYFYFSYLEIFRLLVSELPISEEIDLNEMSFDEQNDIYTWSCRCGGNYRVSVAQLVDGIDTVPCDGCSFAIRISYQEQEEGDEEEETPNFKMKAEGEVQQVTTEGFPLGSESLDHSFFDNLPDEQGLEIFKYLDAHDLYQASTVCRTFSRWASDDSLWRRLYLRYILANRNTNRRSTINTNTSTSNGAGAAHVILFGTSTMWRVAFKERIVAEREQENIIESRNQQIVLLELKARDVEAEVQNVFDYLDGEKEARMRTEEMLMKARAELQGASYEIKEKDDRLKRSELQVHLLAKEIEELTEKLHEAKKRNSLLEKQRESCQETMEKAEEALDQMQKRWATTLQDNFRLKAENTSLLQQLTSLQTRPSSSQTAKDPSSRPKRSSSTIHPSTKGRLPLTGNTKAKCNF